jgi:short-subunit dehydrogenase
VNIPSSNRQRATALITGASSGIGLALARELAAHGHSVVLVARDREKLDLAAKQLELEYGVRVSVYARDLSEPGAAQQIWAELSGRHSVDILVNNAGVGLYGDFREQSLDALTRMQMLNVVALTTLTRLVLPGFVARGRGRILNVASIVGYQPGGPGMAVYYATKAYVLSFTKGLALEVAGTGVSVTALCPGVTVSAFEERAGASQTFLYRRVPQTRPNAVAKAGYRAMMKGRLTVIPGLIAKLFAFSGELPPRVIALLVNRWLLRSPGDGRIRE